MLRKLLAIYEIVPLHALVLDDLGCTLGSEHSLGPLCLFWLIELVLLSLLSSWNCERREHRVVVVDLLILLGRSLIWKLSFKDLFLLFRCSVLPSIVDFDSKHLRNVFVVVKHSDFPDVPILEHSLECRIFFFLKLLISLIIVELGLEVEDLRITAS